MIKKEDAILAIKKFFIMLNDKGNYLIVIPQLNHHGYIEITKLITLTG
jgi:hypothetical protein